MDWIIEENIKSFAKWFVDNQSRIAELEEKNRKLKELLDITVQTKNEKIRNLLEELEYYKKQCGED